MKTSTTIEFTSNDVRKILTEYIRGTLGVAPDSKILLSFDLCSDGGNGHSLKGAKATVTSET